MQQVKFGYSISNNQLNATWLFNNKTPAQAFTPPGDEKKCVLHKVLRRLRRKQGQMQEPLGLMAGGGGLDLQIWDLNRAHETETTVFPIPQVFSMCGCRL